MPRKNSRTSSRRRKTSRRSRVKSRRKTSRRSRVKSRRKTSRKVAKGNRSAQWHFAIKRNWGKAFHDKLERCVNKVKRKGTAYSPYAICFSALKKNLNV